MEVTMQKKSGNNTLAIKLNAKDSTDAQQDVLIKAIAALVEAFEATGKVATR